MGDVHELIRQVIFTANDLVWGWPSALPLIVVLLVGTGLVTTLRLGFVQVRFLRHSVRVIRGDFDHPEDDGDLSHFQALSTALSATVGIGNIAGVATAIHYGGPGALFWMWVTAVFGMALKYTECTLAQRYRTILPGGSAAGGPMYSIERGLGPRWKPLAVAFAVCAVISSFGSGNAVQAFTVADQFRQDLGVPTWLTGLVTASLVAAVILGGIRRIGRVTSRLVPVMASLYVFAAAVVLLLNAREVPGTLWLIVSSAFEPAAQIGGFAGGGFVFMLTWGVKRGLFSNESGQGSAPIAHAAAKTDEPVREGMVALLEPFIDTLVICTMTGLVILLTGVWHERQTQVVPLDAQSAVTVIVDSAEVLPNGALRPEDLVVGAVEVTDGRATGVLFVRNHATVADPVLSLAPSGLALAARAPFTGTVLLDPARPGLAASAVATSADGGRAAGTLVLEGGMLQNGSPLTAWAFREGLGRLAGGRGHLLVTISVFLFGLSTAISWSYYGDRSMYYLVGARWVMPYRVVFCVAHFFGAVFALELVWGFGDVALGLMTVPNLLSILLMTHLVGRWTREYVEGGKLEPHR